jgi:shikimate dehydrogenase
MSDAITSRAHENVMRCRAAVLGCPISHSLSPILHRAAYSALGLDWTYEAREVDVAGLAGFLDSCDASWAGVSLTMPLKTIALALLDGVDASAQLVEAVNTIVWSDGRRIGYNTDIYGMQRAIEEVRGDKEISSVAIVGAGATARSALAAIARMLESGHIESPDDRLNVELFARQEQSAVALKDFVSKSALAARIRVIVQPWANRERACHRDLVVSTVPGSAAAEIFDSGISFEDGARPGVLMDVAYEPWPTPLVRLWRGHGGVAATGDLMLLWQAAEQVRLMTGCEPPVDAMRVALVDSLRERATQG